MVIEILIYPLEVCRAGERAQVNQATTRTGTI
jgi:hypothetical protein